MNSRGIFARRLDRLMKQTLKIRINFFREMYEKKYSDMLNMKALVGVRIILMGKEFE